MIAKPINAAIVALALALAPSPAVADGPPRPKVSASGHAFAIKSKITTSPTVRQGISTIPGRKSSPGSTAKFVPLTPAQRAFNDANSVACLAVITSGGTCPQPDPAPVQQAVAAPAPRPQLTRGMIVAAFRRIPVPKERSVAQPGNKTLVNFDTIFYTRADGFQRTVSLVGQQVTLDIAPVSYTWHPGDGAGFTTRSPGGPYPDKTVTHRYQKAHVTVAHHVDVNWGARFRVNGGPWTDIAGTVTSVGPATDLRVAEATPVLKGVATRG